jgi:hypothetical protein
MELLLYEFLTPTTDGRELSYSRPGCFTTENTAPATRSMGSLVDPRRIPCPMQGIKPKFSGRPVHSIVTMLTELKIAKTHVRVQVWF